MSINNMTYKNERIELLLGLHFFLANAMFEHEVDKFSILDLLSKFGGLYGSIFQVVGVIGAFYNSRMVLGHLISKFYFIKYKEEGQRNHKLSLINFTKYDVFSNFKLVICKGKNLFCKKLCCREPLSEQDFMSQSEIIYHTGHDKISELICIEKILITI